MAITWTDDNTSINTCEAKGDWTGTGFSNPDDNTSGSATPVFREGNGCMGATAASTTNGSWSDTIAVNLTDKALVWWIWLSGPTEFSAFSFFQVEVEDGAAFVNYDFLPEIVTLDKGGWFPAVLWPTDDGETFITSSGTIVIAGIDTLTIRANNTSGGDVKLVGWDYIHALGFIGAAGDAVALEDFQIRDVAQNFGVVSQVGTTFQAQCLLRYGGTGTTTVNESNKTITFRGANSDHPVGFVFNSGGTATNITYTDMVFNWTFPQPAFDLVAAPNTFRFDGCSFNGAGTIDTPAHSTLRHIKTSKFNACGEIDIGDLVFEDNTVSNALSGVLYAGTGTRRAKNNTYSGCTDALHFDTAQTISLDGDTFTGNTTDIHFSGTGTLTVNAINGANPATSRVTGGGTVVINNTVAVAVTVTDDAGADLQNARVLLEAAAGGPLPDAESVTITRSGTTATVTHTAHGVPDGGEVAIRGANQVEYTGIKTISVVNANSYTFTVAGSPTTPATGTITATAVILNGLTDVNGLIEDTGFNYSSDQPVSGIVRKASASPYWKDSPVSGTIGTGGFSANIQMVRDE